MKKKLSYLAIVLLTVCLVGFAFDRIVPAGSVHAANETSPVLSSAGTAETEAVPRAPSAQPVVLVVTGLVGALFGVIAVSPLVIGDPVRVLQEANRGEQ